MKQQPTDRETAKYNALSEIAALLRETTVKRISYPTGHSPGESSSGMYVHDNIIFNQNEHQTVKRAFLKLCEEI